MAQMTVNEAKELEKEIEKEIEDEITVRRYLTSLARLGQIEIAKSLVPLPTADILKFMEAPEGQQWN